MKLISLNIEGEEHPETVFPFLQTEAADVVCLQEAPEEWCEELHALGYHTTFAPMLIRDTQPEYTEGIILASKEAHNATTYYYRRSAEDITVYVKRGDTTIAHPVIIASVLVENEHFVVAGTHVMVTMDGRADDQQRLGVQKLLSILADQEPHVLCGDFNMPRGVNELYADVTKFYIDAIPPEYPSSLDKNLHRLGQSDALNEPIFESYMVDYIFTQLPYHATDVRLQFGVSDHAAVVGTISKNTV